MSECWALEQKQKGLLVFRGSRLSQEQVGTEAIAGTWATKRKGLAAGAVDMVGQPHEHCPGRPQQCRGRRHLRRRGCLGVTSEDWGWAFFLEVSSCGYFFHSLSPVSPERYSNGSAASSSKSAEGSCRRRRQPSSSSQQSQWDTGSPPTKRQRRSRGRPSSGARRRQRAGPAAEQQQHQELGRPSSEGKVTCDEDTGSER
ncbi:DNA-binding death effector domain-containing protein 2 isoform X1 [Cricetulus griseus]|uniref:DNA-binding death effector domain-containing protein 2 isoform X1 n=1 Tax=Cricetulus griseus TaxID=10029 RepID=UPI0004541FF9|nr:DNA-binding death effector domain-containing protein 2 isoform X1 [Cricetulus griseus]